MMTSILKTYSIAKKKKAFLLAGICLLCAFVIPIILCTDIPFNFSSDNWIGLVIVLMWFCFWSVMAYVVYKWALTAKLVISENKIECDDIACLVGFSTDWENIEYVFVSKMHLTLYLKKPSEPITKLGHWVIAHNWISSHVIDLSSFIDHWKGGELKQDFEQYAPYLFDEEGKLKPEAA